MGPRRTVGPVPEERLVGIIGRLGRPGRERVLLQIVEEEAVAPDPIGREEVPLDLVVGLRTDALVPGPIDRVVLVAEAWGVLQVEPVGVLILPPLVLVVGSAQLQGPLGRRFPGDLPDPGPRFAPVRGQDAVLEETGLGGGRNFIRDGTGTAILAVAALPCP